MAKISIVEDEHIVAWDLKETLEKLGHTVVDRVVSGAEAIHSVTATKPDLVLMDIRLEGEIDGIAAADDIYHRLDTPVVFLTAHADETTLKRATRTEPFGYVVKPFQSQSLQTTIELALQRHQLEVATKLTNISLMETIDSIGAGIIVTDRQGLVTSINAPAQAVTGWSESAALGVEIDRVFRLIWESDGTAIENPCRRAMRLDRLVKSPDKCWLVSRDNDEIPIYDTATPLRNNAGQVVGSTLIFQDNSERVIAHIEWQEEWAQKLADFQLKSISHLQRETAHHHLALACIQVLDRVFQHVWTAKSEDEILSHALHALGTEIDADYCWVTIHDPQQATARAICEYVRSGGVAPVASAIGKQIDLQLYPQFYRHLCQSASWIEPPRSIVPDVYLDLLLPGSQLLVCPLAVTDDRHPGTRLWVMGEIGAITTGSPQWLSAQAQLIARAFSYALDLFRQRQILTDSSHRSSRGQDLMEPIGDRQLDGTLPEPPAPSDSTPQSDLYQQYQLTDYIDLAQAVWRKQADLSAIGGDVDGDDRLPSATTTLGTLEFHHWIERIAANCQRLTDRYHQHFALEIISELPSLVVCNFPVLEAIVMEIIATACQWMAPHGLMIANVAATAERLELTVVYPTIDSRSANFPFADLDRASDRVPWQSVNDGELIAIVKLLLSYLGGQISTQTDPGWYRLVLTIPI